MFRLFVARKAIRFPRATLLFATCVLTACGPVESNPPTDLPSCRAQANCAKGEVCTDGGCVVGCERHEDCAEFEGCTEFNQCEFTCATSGDCNRGFSCVREGKNNRCVRPGSSE